MPGLMEVSVNKSDQLMKVISLSLFKHIFLGLNNAFKNYTVDSSTIYKCDVAVQRTLIVLKEYLPTKKVRCHFVQQRDTFYSPKETRQLMCLDFAEQTKQNKFCCSLLVQQIWQREQVHQPTVRYRNSSIDLVTGC